MNTRIFQCNGLRRPLVLAVKTRGKNSAINSGSSIKIWYKFQILKGLPGTHDFHRDVVHTRLQDGRDFPYENADLWCKEFSQYPASQKLRHRLDEMKVPASTNLRDYGCHLGIIQGVFQGIRAGGWGYIRSDFHIDGEPLL